MIKQQAKVLPFRCSLCLFALHNKQIHVRYASPTLFVQHIERDVPEAETDTATQVLMTLVGYLLHMCQVYFAVWWYNTGHAQATPPVCFVLPSCTYVYYLLHLYLQEQVVHDSQQTLEAKSITASSLRHRLSNLKCTLETELEGVLAISHVSDAHMYTCPYSCIYNCSILFCICLLLWQLYNMPCYICSA